MASTDIGPTLTADFDETIPVPGDGDYANQATLINMVKPLGNRTKYLKQIIEDAPWRKSEFFEDFKSIVEITSPANASIFDTAWQRFETNPASQSIVGGLADALGILDMSHSAGTVSSNLFSKGIISGIGNFLCRATNFRRATARVRTGNIASGMNFEVGIDGDSVHAVAGGNANCISVTFKPADSPNWRLRVANGAASNYTDTGVAVAANTWYQLDLTSDGANVVELSVDGAAAVTANPANLPSMTADMAAVLRYGMPNAGASRIWQTDFVYMLFDVAGRVL